SVDSRQSTVDSPLGLDAAGWARLEERIRAGVAVARRDRRQVLASASSPVDASVDLSAAVLGSRRADDRFFCLEQPDRDGFALAGLGTAALVRGSGARRFAEAARDCRALAHGALFDEGPGPQAGGPVFVGGFAFAPDGGRTPEWSSVWPAQLVLPEVSLARRGGESLLTVNVVVDGDESPDAVVERLEARIAGLEPHAMPLLDPDPVVKSQVASAAPPEHFEATV